MKEIAMANYQRINTLRSGDLAVVAGDFWRVLLDWDKITDWMPTNPAPVPISHVELAPGHEVGKVPCTRNIYFDVEKLPPEVPKEILPEMVPETLLHFDDEARFIYYNMESAGPLPFGMRNYLATTTVDALDAGHCRVTCSGRFDLPEGVPPEVVKGFIENVYDGIIGGIEAYLLRKG
jgi:Polyketide cyclase / dehydrase and lipid transport